MGHDADHTLGKPPGIVRMSAIRGRRRAPLHSSAGEQTRSWRPRTPESRGTTACCIRSKSSRFQAHPFREGNGRAGKLFMQQVSELSQYKLEYSPELSGVTREMWNNASAMSRPDRGSYAPVPDTLIPIFERMTAPRLPERTHETQRDPSQASEQESPSLEHRLETKLGELRARRDPNAPNPTRKTARDVPEARDGDRPYQPPGDRWPRTGR